MFLKPVFISVAIMLSSTVRAFTSAPATTTFGAMKRMGPSFIARSMTSTSEADTTIVSTCREKIMKALETDDVTVTGAYDDPNGSHIAVEVVSPLFSGKRPVQRQQLVYKAIWEELQGPVHAVDSMICKTPEEK